MPTTSQPAKIHELQAYLEDLKVEVNSEWIMFLFEEIEDPTPEQRQICDSLLGAELKEHMKKLGTWPQEVE